MNRHSLQYRIAGFILLISVSMPGLLGSSLHALAHLSPPGAESTAESPTCPCCCDCKANTDDSATPRAAEEHDCAICRYLALSKQVERAWEPEIIEQIAFGEVGSYYLFEPSSAFSLKTAPRGPPALS